MRAFFKTTFFCFWFALLNQGCAQESVERSYRLGERLWLSKEYDAAVSRFREAYRKDRNSYFGRLAYFRAARTQSIFLSEHEPAAGKLKILIDLLFWSI